MAYDHHLQQRIAEAFSSQAVEADTVKMFGGITFMVRGNMSVGITSKGDFLAKFDPEKHAEASEWPGAKPFVMGRGDNKGILLVDAKAVETPRALEKWVELSLEHVLKLPIKVKKATKGKGVVKK